jgi:hypothetical protein
VAAGRRRGAAWRLHGYLNLLVHAWTKGKVPFVEHAPGLRDTADGKAIARFAAAGVLDRE